MDEPATKVEIRDWQGLITKTDRRDLPPGAGQIQVNLASTVTGELTVRRGLLPVRFG